MGKSHTLADLRPNATITCGYCNTVKPQAGSAKFHMLLICKECTVKLQSLVEADKKPKK